ncbi:MAG TPA: glycosyltransferase [Actinomycetota bacterium]|nr:glycosyltransferase [Actinomycetota bacterium]
MTDAFLTYADPNRVPSLLEEPPACEFSVLTLNEGWPEDLERFAASLAATSPGASYELLAASNASPDVEAAVRGLAARDGRVRGLFFSQHVGFGAARNAGILQARGRIVIVADTSIEATGDFLSPLAAALAKPSIGMAGNWGLLSGDLRTFHETTEGEVDALQAYCMAFRRADAGAVGLFDPRFKFYRNADIDYSLRWRSKGFRLVATPLPLTRHTHREWESIGEDERERKSRDNFARLLRSWRDRTDLLTGGSGAESVKGVAG